jgi:hypothetical protein
MKQDVIIVGAPRSGTNMLRDVLTAMPGFASWPCDEVNLLWRHGNRDHPDDELSAAQATPKIARYLHRRFDRIRARYDAEVVVEKTCATSLRVEFTRELFPDAKYLFITRDGVDAAASAIDRCNAPLDIRYTAAKARFVPASDLPFYGFKFATNQLKRRGARKSVDRTGLQTWWGPKLHDYRDLMRRHSVAEACMVQWQRCVEASQRGLESLGAEQSMHISYEEFVQKPEEHLVAIMSFLGRSGGDRRAAVAGVSTNSIGKGRSQLGSATVARLESLGGSVLKDLGYV